MNAMKGEQKRYTRADLEKAKQAMLHSLAELSGGELLRGCCTQGCCDDEAQAMISWKSELSYPPYTKQDLINAKRAMLAELAAISGGQLVAGCGTQGCVDLDAASALINLP